MLRRIPAVYSMDIDLHNLTWTDRDTVRARLTDFLNVPPPRAEDNEVPQTQWQFRHRATLLVARLCESGDDELLQRLLLDTNETEDLRLAALEGLYRRNTRLPASCLDMLGPRDPLWHTPTWPAELCTYLARLEGGPSSGSLRRYLKWLSPSGRAKHLIHFLTLPDAGPAELRGWLYRQWLLKDCLLLNLERGDSQWERGRRVALNTRIASLTHDRPESAVLLDEYRRLPTEHTSQYVRLGGVPIQPDSWESMPPELWSGETELVEVIRAAVDEFLPRAEALDLPYTALLEYFTPETLLAQIEEVIRSASRRLPHAATYNDCMTTKVYRALELLQKWPDESLHPRLESLVLCPEMHSHLRSHLHSIYWCRVWETAAETCRAPYVSGLPKTAACATAGAPYCGSAKTLVRKNASSSSDVWKKRRRLSSAFAPFRPSKPWARTLRSGASASQN